MATPIPWRIGDGGPILLQWYPTATDTGTNGQSLSGCTSLAASVTTADGTITKTADAVSATDAANGKVSITFNSGTVTAAGLYYLKFTFTDTAGKARIWPSEYDNVPINFQA